MRPEESFVGQPIRSLQTMLRVLAESDEKYQSVIPDGIYGTSTIQAVSNFQRIHGLPVTGMTDQQTWEAIAAEYEPALIQASRAELLEIILNPGEVLRRGEKSPYLRVAQALLYEIDEAYGSLGKPSLSGVLDPATANSLSAFQRLAGLPMTGELDKITWKHLALHFPLAANHSRNTSNGIGNRENVYIL